MCNPVNERGALICIYGSQQAAGPAPPGRRQPVRIVRSEFSVVLVHILIISLSQLIYLESRDALISLGRLFAQSRHNAERFF